MKGRSRGPLLRSRPRTVTEVPRRQSTGRCCSRDVVAEIEDRIEEVFEGELGDGLEPGHEIASVAAGARPPRCVPDCPALRFCFMAAPIFFRTIFHKPRS